MATTPAPTLDERDKQPGESIWSFKGRIGRGTFWLVFVSVFLAGLLVQLLLGAMSFGGREMLPLVVVIYVVVLFFQIWLSLATQVKRWHDLDQSGWMVLINLTIIGAPIALIILGCVRGTTGPNKYGSDPLHPGLAPPPPILAAEGQAIPALEAQPQMSPISRIIGVLFSPKKTFEDVARKPGWIVPMVVLLLISIGLSVTLALRTDWVEVSKDQIAKSKLASGHIDQLSEDQKDRVYEQAATRSKIIRYVRGFIGWPLLLLIVSAIYFGAFKLIGGARTNFATAFAVTAFAHIPVGLRELIAIPVNLLKDPASIDPENFLVSNPAAILGNDIPTWQTVPLVFLDVFGLWALLLMAVGFSATDPKKLPFGKSLGIVAGVSLTFVLFFTMIAWVFS